MNDEVLNQQNNESFDTSQVRVFFLIKLALRY